MPARGKERRRRTGIDMLAWAVVFVLASPQQVASELVLLAGGGVLKVDAYHREGERMRLLLPSGGTLTVSMLRIERVVADELVEEGPELGPWGEVALSLSFDARQPVPDTPFGELIYQASRRHDVNSQLVVAMVRAESAFDPLAVSEKGAAGLLQLMPATARRFGLEIDEIFDPRRNLDAGVRYIRWLSERFDGVLPLVLAGYNAGEATVDRYQGVPPFRETREYLLRIYRAVGLSPTDRGLK